MENHWNKVYEKFKLEYRNKEDHSKMDMLTILLTKFSIYNTLKASLLSSSSSPPSIQPWYNGQVTKEMVYRLLIKCKVLIILVVCIVQLIFVKFRIHDVDIFFFGYMYGSKSDSVLLHFLFCWT